VATPLQTLSVEWLGLSSDPSNPRSASLLFFLPNRRLNGWNLPCRRRSGKKKWGQTMVIHSQQIVKG